MGLSKIKFPRMKKGLTQWDIARQVQISESTMNRIENGRTAPTPDLAERIAQVLDVQVKELEEEAL